MPQNMLLIVVLGNEALLCCVQLTVCTHDREREVPPPADTTRTLNLIATTHARISFPGGVGQAGKGLMVLQVMNMRQFIISGQFNYQREVLGFEVNGSPPPLPSPPPPPQTHKKCEGKVIHELREQDYVVLKLFQLPR